MEFSTQEYWTGLPFPSPGDLPNPEIEPWSPALQADSLLPEPPGKPEIILYTLCSQTGNQRENETGNITKDPTDMKRIITNYVHNLVETHSLK